MNLRSTGYVRGLKSDRIVSFRSSTPDLDRHGTRILPEGIGTDNYDRNPVFLWGHDGYGGLMGGPDIESIIGRTISHAKSRDGFDHDVEFAPASVNPKADMAYKMVRTGFLNSTSIGFEPRSFTEEKRAAGETGPPIIVFDAVDLLEVSLVPIPSNPNAQALARALATGRMDSFLHGLGDDDLAGRVEAWVRSAVDGTHGDHRTHPSRATHGERGKEDTHGDPLVDMIKNMSVREWRPTVGRQLLNALEKL